jgi:hypothetical protein
MLLITIKNKGGCIMKIVLASILFIIISILLIGCSSQTMAPASPAVEPAPPAEPSPAAPIPNETITPSPTTFTPIKNPEPSPAISASPTTAITPSPTRTSSYEVNLPGMAGIVPDDLTFSEWEGKLNLPSELEICKAVYPEVDEDYVMDIAKKLGGDGYLKEGDGWYKFIDSRLPPTPVALENPACEGAVDLIVYKSTGGIDYHRFGEDVLFPSKEHPEQNLPPDKEAKAIGLEFFSKLGLNEISADNIVVNPGSGESTVTSLIVGNKFKINNLPVVGSKYGIRIGRDSIIAEALINPVKYELGEKVPLKSLKTAYNDMKAGHTWGVPNYLQNPDMTARTVVIDRVYIAYWLTTMARQDLIVPVYVFEGHSLNAAGKVIEYADIGGVRTPVPFRGYTSAPVSADYEEDSVEHGGTGSIIPKDLTFKIAVP